MEYDEIVAGSATKDGQGQARDLRTAADFSEAGFDVRLLGSPDEELAGQGATDVDGEDAEVSVESFAGWLELSACRHGSAVARWWSAEPVGAEGDVARFKAMDEETAVDLFEKIKLALDGSVRVRSLVEWLVARGGVGGAFVLAEDLDAAQRTAAVQLLAEEVQEELYCVGVHATIFKDSAPMDLDPESAVAEEAENLRTAERLAHGWPSRRDEATLPRQPGRLAKAFPLELPMGIGDLHDERPRQVSPGEHAQHLLRLRSGRIVNGLRGHRIVWALVNSVLVGEAAGKGFAVHRNVMKRLGGRVEGTSVLTRRRLREMMENEESCRAIVGQLMTVGRDVRSTPMQWSYEGKKLDCAVKHLAWRPPWVKSSEVGEPDSAAPFVEPDQMVETGSA